MRKWGDEVTTSRLCAPSSSSSSRYVSFLPLHFLSVSAGLIWTSVIVLSLSTFLLPIESARETVSFFCRCCANDIHFNDDYANEFGNANSAAGRVDRLWTTSSFTWCPFWLTSGSIEAVKGKTTSTSESGKRRRRASEMSRGSWLKRARHLIHAATFVMSRDFTTHDDAPESIARAGLHSFSLLYFILIFFVSSSFVASLRCLPSTVFFQLLNGLCFICLLLFFLSFLLTVCRWGENERNPRERKKN